MQKSKYLFVIGHKKNLENIKTHTNFVCENGQVLYQIIRIKASGHFQAMDYEKLLSEYISDKKNSEIIILAHSIKNGSTSGSNYNDLVEVEKEWNLKFTLYDTSYSNYPFEMNIVHDGNLPTWNEIKEHITKKKLKKIHSERLKTLNEIMKTIN